MRYNKPLFTGGQVLKEGPQPIGCGIFILGVVHTSPGHVPDMEPAGGWMETSRGTFQPTQLYEYVRHPNNSSN